MAIKVVKAEEMSRIEGLAYKEGASEIEFMEKAGAGVASKARNFIAVNHLRPKIALLCGQGNNGGDAYVAGRLLLEGDFEIFALSFGAREKLSPLAKIQSEKFLNEGGIIYWIERQEDIDFRRATLLIDGILGTGFHGEVKGLFKDAIEKANDSKIPILAVDIPSGIDGNNGLNGPAIKASVTVFLGLPKLGCFLGDAWNATGKVHVHNFGLKEEFIEKAEAIFFLIEPKDVTLPLLKRNRHKYERGYVVGIGGSKGMPGAPILSSFASLRAGAGIVRLFHPEEMNDEFGNAPAEIIREGYKIGKFDSLREAIKKASGLFIGPGIGTTDNAKIVLQEVLTHVDKPIVIDAEALTLIAKHSFEIPENAILTPHHGEMKRLLDLKNEILFMDFVNMCQSYVDKKNIILVLKGAPTIIFQSKKTPYICSRGDPGMATAGSGDVLTGVIASFLAQKKSPFDAAISAVYIHGIAGEIAAKDKTSYSVIASDITKYLPDAMRETNQQIG